MDLKLKVTFTASSINQRENDLLSMFVQNTGHWASLYSCDRISRNIFLVQNKDCFIVMWWFPSLAQSVGHTNLGHVLDVFTQYRSVSVSLMMFQWCLNTNCLIWFACEFIFYQTYAWSFKFVCDITLWQTVMVFFANRLLFFRMSKITIS